MVKKILVSQPAPTTEKSPYFDIAAKHGVEFVFHPFIKVECLTPKEFRQQKIQVLDYSAIVFTSRHAIDNFFTGVSMNSCVWRSASERASSCLMRLARSAGWMGR